MKPWHHAISFRCQWGAQLATIKTSKAQITQVSENNEVKRPDGISPLLQTVLCCYVPTLTQTHINVVMYVMNYSFIDLGVTILMFYRKISPGVVIGWGNAIEKS